MRLVTGYIAGLLLIFIVLALGALGGCATSQVQDAVDEAGDEIAQAQDVKLETYRRLYCDAPTMGAVRRAYAGQPEMLGRYLMACGWETWPD